MFLTSVLFPAVIIPKSFPPLALKSAAICEDIWSQDFPAFVTPGSSGDTGAGCGGQFKRQPFSRSPQQRHHWRWPIAWAAHCLLQQVLNDELLFDSDSAVVGPGGLAMAAPGVGRHHRGGYRDHHPKPLFFDPDADLAAGLVMEFAIARRLTTEVVWPPVV